MDKMKFRPLHDRVLVRRIESEGRTAGGILIPDTAQEKPMEGEIVAVGPGARDVAGALVAPTVREGDRVLFGKWTGSEVRIAGEDYLILKESDLLGLVEGLPGEHGISSGGPSTKSVEGLPGEHGTSSGGPIKGRRR
ncbi:co-chaperonin GroES (HSP10) [Rhodobium gokarnense]|uniref:Co-chaperonin GroES n=1 Tax=Rhodobium gokarnense TaxID=364296 RepID=A0ABT3H6T6_9HYPH|nr:co-chaperonin GroES (HSP10) [Rhodobium gokarnense]